VALGREKKITFGQTASFPYIFGRLFAGKLVLDGVLLTVIGGKKRGVTWRMKESLEDMEHADGLRLISHKLEHMQRKLDISGRNIRK
jgi:hypothetical protein